MKRNLLLIVLTLFFLSTALPGHAETVQLKSFTEIMDALKSGKIVRGIFHYKRCKLIIDNEESERIPDAVGGMSLETFEYFAKGSIRNDKAYVSASHSVLINHANYGLIYNYAKIRIYEDGKVRIIAQYLKPATFEIEMNESFYTEVNDGKNNAGAYFYVEK